MSPSNRLLALLCLALLSLGCGADVDTNLRIEGFAFAKSQPPFPMGKPIDLRFVVKGFSRSGKSVHVCEDLRLIDPEGQIVLNKENVTVIQEELPDNYNLLTFTNNLSTNSGAAPGTYELTITIRDQGNDKRCTHAVEFLVKG